MPIQRGGYGLLGREIVYSERAAKRFRNRAPSAATGLFVLGLNGYPHAIPHIEPFARVSPFHAALIEQLAEFIC